MDAEMDDVFERALCLPRSERHMLAVVLVDSLRDERSPEESEAYWEAEIKRRIRDFEGGRTELIPWEEVQRQLRELRDTCSVDGFKGG